jgi:glycosyltransferase involved in cell wall biosynthesis
MIAVSDDLRHFLIDRIGIKNEQITTVPNGINMNLYCPNNVLREKIRKELNIGEEKIVIGSIGNLYPVKGHTYLIQTAALVIRKLPDTIFIIVGRGKLLETLQQEVRELGIQNNIHFLGFREDIPALLQAIDVFVLPSLSEGLPLSVLEAMASKKPIIATKVGGLPEVVIDGQSGLLVLPKDPVELAEKILLLCRNMNTAKNLAKAAYKRVSEDFSLAKTLNRYEKLYEQLLH